MELKPLIAMCILLNGLVGWLIWDQFVPLEAVYEKHNASSDPLLGKDIKPKDFIQLHKVIKQSDDYLNNTNAIERLHDLIYEINKADPFQIDQSYSNEEQLRLSGMPHANQTKCGQDLNWILSELKQSENFASLKGKLGRELTQLIDSNGKPEAGLYNGLVTWMGSYEQCKRLEFSENKLKTRYCWSRFKFNVWSTNETIQPKTTIRVGSCLPVSCDTQSEQIYAQEISSLIKFDWPEFYAKNLQFDSMFCLPDEESPLRQISTGGWIFILSFSSWILLILIASAAFKIMKNKQNKELEHDKNLAISLTLLPNGKQQIVEMSGENKLVLIEKINRSWIRKLLASLSLSETFKGFIQHSKHNELSRLNTNWLNGLKSIMSIAIVSAHTYFYAWLHVRSLSSRIESTRDYRSHAIVSIGHFVDTYFVLFAIFGTQYLISKFKLDYLYKPSIWFLYNLKTFMRVTPLCVIVSLFARYVNPYLSEGPWWDYGNDKHSTTSECQSINLWLILLPYLSFASRANYNDCNPPAWFLIIYLRLALFIPIIVYILHKLPNHWWRSMFVLFISLITNAQFALRLYRQESLTSESFALYGSFLLTLLEQFQATGTALTYTRIGLVAVSCYSGYLLCMYKRGEINKWPKWLSSFWCLLLIIFAHLIILFTPLIGLYSKTVPTIEQVAISTYLMKILWPIINCILILQATTIYNRTALVRFLSLQFWTSLNRLGLGIYLIHWTMLSYSINGNDLVQIFVVYSHYLAMYVYSLTLILAIFAYFFIETPMQNMFNLIFINLEKSLKK